LTDDTTRLFGLEGVAVAVVELDEHANPMLMLVTARESARCCPGRGTRATHPHSWVRTRPRDLPVAGGSPPASATWARRGTTA